MSAPKNLVLTGKPGSGKTTLIKEAILPFRAQADGFLTEEIREQGTRAGFRLVSFDGTGGILASKRLPGPPRLNKYGIDLGVLESIGAAGLKRAVENRKIVVIDEIGSMEVMSEPFRAAVVSAFQSELPVLATIRLGSQPFTDAVKNMPDTEVWEVDKAHFSELRTRVRDWLKQAAARLA